MTPTPRNGKIILAAGLALAIPASAALAAGPAPNRRINVVMASARTRVHSVASPPAVIRPGERLKLQIRATRAPVFYLSHESRRARTGVRLSARVHVRRGRGTAVLTIPRKLSPGAWFVLACVPRGRCAASKTPGVVALAHPGPPVNASVTLAGASAATATISAAGGSLQTTGPNGTRYLLTIPPNSLAQDTTITMTPLGGLSGARFTGKLIGGVQFAPEGLLLLRGATLTITPRHPVPIRRQVPFGYTATGADLHVVPLASAKTSIQIPIAHFSGAGLGDSPGGTGGAPAASDNAGFYGQMLGQLESDWRDGSMSEDQFDAAAASLLNDMYRDIMNEEVPPGLNDDTAATTAIHDLLSWARTAELLLESHDETNWGANEIDGRVFPTVIKLMTGVYRRAQQRCANNHDLSEINNHIIPDAHNLELLGVPEIPISELYSCLRFTVRIDSQIHHVDSGFSGGFDWHYQASIVIKYASASSAGVSVNGAGPGSYASATGSETKTDHGGCHDGTDIIDTVALDTPNGNSVSVPQFTFPIASTDPPDIKLTLGSSASETYRLDEQDASNPDCSAPTFEQTAPYWWREAWLSLVANGAVSQSAFGATTISLDRGSGATFAQKTIPASDGDSGQTTITVIHDPPSH